MYGLFESWFYVRASNADLYVFLLYVQPGAIIFDLKKNKDTRFPVKEESRFVSGWRNGLYDIGTFSTSNCRFAASSLTSLPIFFIGTDKNRFYPYESLAFKHLPDSLIGCMFTDQVFDNAAYEYTIQRKGWQGLETPELDAIPKVQRWDPDQALWWYAGVARMLYPCKTNLSLDTRRSFDMYALICTLYC